MVEAPTRADELNGQRKLELRDGKHRRDTGPLER